MHKLLRTSRPAVDLVVHVCLLLGVDPVAGGEKIWLCYIRNPYDASEMLPLYLSYSPSHISILWNYFSHPLHSYCTYYVEVIEILALGRKVLVQLPCRIMLIHSSLNIVILQDTNNHDNQRCPNLFFRI